MKARGGPKPVAAKVGATKVTWTPRGLKPGRYRLTTTPAGGSGITRTFTVRR